MKPHPDAGKYFSLRLKRRASKWETIGGPFWSTREALNHCHLNADSTYEIIIGRLDDAGKMWLDLTTYEG